LVILQSIGIKGKVVLYIGIIKVRDFGPKLSPQNQLEIYFLTVWEYWLGIAKPKNVFRLILNPSDKHNSRTARARDLISSLINVA